MDVKCIGQSNKFDSKKGIRILFENRELVIEKEIYESNFLKYLLYVVKFYTNGCYIK